MSTTVATDTEPDPGRIYQSLGLEPNSLRLLEINTEADDEGFLNCCLSNFTFGEKPRYTALSYCWGSTADTRHLIRINGLSFAVSRRLHDALCFIRDFKDGLFWIDAICINQNDLPERAEQVKIMHRIYERAHKVIVWLGASYESLGPLPDVKDAYPRNGLRHAILKRINKGSRNYKLYDSCKAVSRF